MSLKQLQAIQRDLTAKVKQLTKENVSLCHDVSNFQQFIADERVKNDKLKLEIDRLKNVEAEKVALEDTLAQLTSASKQLQYHYRTSGTVRVDVANVRRENEELLQRAIEQEGELSEMRMNLRENDAKLTHTESTREQLAARVDELEARNKRLHEQQDTAQRTVEHMTSKINELQTARRNQERELKVLRDSRMKLERDNISLQKRVESTTHDNIHLRTTKRALDALGNRHARVDAQLEELGRLAEAEHKMKTELLIVQKQNKQLVRENRELYERVESQDALVLRLRDELLRLREKAGTLSGADAERTAAMGALEKLTEAARVLRGERDQLRMHADALEEQVSNQKVELEQATKIVKDREHEASALRHKNESAKRVFNQAMKTMVKMHRDHEYSIHTQDDFEKLLQVVRKLVAQNDVLEKEAEEKRLLLQTSYRALANLKTEKSRLDEELHASGATKEQLERLKMEGEMLRSRLKRLEGTYNQIKELHGEKTRMVGVFKTERDTLAEKNRALETENTTLKHQLQRLHLLEDFDYLAYRKDLLSAKPADALVDGAPPQQQQQPATLAMGQVPGMAGGMGRGGPPGMGPRMGPGSMRGPPMRGPGTFQGQGSPAQFGNGAW